MFSESTKADIKAAAEEAVDQASQILVIGSSLATYSAWRLAKRAQERGKPIARMILNIGGVRGEDKFFAEVLKPLGNGADRFRASLSTEKVLPILVEKLQGRSISATRKQPQDF